MTAKTTVTPAAAGMDAGTIDAAAGVLAGGAELGSSRSSAPAPRNNNGVPTAIEPEAGLASQPLGPGWADSIYVSGQVRSGERRFAYLVHVMTMPQHAWRQQTVTITDVTMGTTRIHTVMVPADRFRWDSGKLDIRTPDLTWTGDAGQQKINATTPWGALDIDLAAQGPVMYYAGTGTFALLGNQQYQYALPQMRTTGTFTADGHSWAVTGDSWLDRQWGQFPNPASDGPNASAYRWTWMGMSMPGGDQVAIWNAKFVAGAAGTEEAWATVLHPDGTHELVPVTPLAQEPGRTWTSPVTGQVYSTQWEVTIPSRQTALTVTVTPKEQEIVGPVGDRHQGTGPRYQGPATFTGTYLGRPVTGETYPEQVGAWTA